MFVVHADAVLTGDGAPLRDGAVVVEASGSIVDVGPATSLVPLGLEVVRIRGVVFPGLVNAHTHVELSALRGHVPGGAGFVPWVERLVGARSDVDPEHDEGALARAADELDAAGTAAVGEVTNTLAAVGWLGRRGLAGAVFHEVFGVDRAFAERRIRALAREREAVGSWPEAFSYAPAPHTLYTTHVEAVLWTLAETRKLGTRTSLHLAEHSAERRALEVGDGPVADWYGRLGLPFDGVPWPHLSPVAFAEKLGALAPDVVLVHLADARPAELDKVAESQAPVVICPRSNLHIELRLPPFLAMRAAGIEAALGTDSLASNSSLDVLDEARALAVRFPMVPARELLQMATWNGARALGRPDLGRIVKGGRPGLVAVEGDIAIEGEREDPCAWLLRSAKLPRRWVVRREP